MPILFPFRSPPYAMKILIVTDGSGGFDVRTFGLSTLVALLQQHARAYVSITVTRAHRDNDPSTPHNNFRFAAGTLIDQGALQYDSVWLFGVNRHDSPSPLSDAELGLLTAFMNAGGGVFATGDHESMGYGLCGRIPRVRSMRSWWFPTTQEIDTDPTGTSPDGFNQPVAPSFGGPKRHDTLVQSPADLAHPGYYRFDDQSDALPQTIKPVWFTQRTVFQVLRYPHPLLCGPEGVIEILPDHPHEGDCHVPNVTNAGLLHPAPPPAGAPATDYEYPTVSGHQELPVVVARAHITAGHSTQPPSYNLAQLKPPTVGGDFGVIAAYDGHRVDVGRVSVDATWHHFFDINLIGTGALPTSGVAGVLGSDPLNHPLNHEIIDYYRNIAVWLAPPAAQTAMLHAGILWLLQTNPLNEELRPGLEASPAFKRYAGIVARDALGRLAGKCQTASWVWSLIYAEGPVRIIGPGPVEDGNPAIDPHVLSEHVLGDLVTRVARNAKSHEFHEPAALAKHIAQAAPEAAQAGLRTYLASAQTLTDHFTRAVGEVHAKVAEHGFAFSKA